MDFGTLVKLRRKQKNITLNNLANNTDISASYLSRLENGERTPVITIALKLAEELDISFEEIQEVYGINLNEHRSNEEMVLPQSKDYININNINKSLIEIANGNKNFYDEIPKILEDISKLNKEPVSILATYDEYIQIINIKFYNQKIIDFLKGYLIDTAKFIMLIEGHIVESDIDTETYDLLDYLEIIEYSCKKGSYDNENLQMIKEYLKEINY